MKCVSRDYGEAVAITPFNSHMPPSIPLVTPTKARDIARSLKSLADDYTEIGMHHDEANCMMRGSEWWLAYAMTMEHTKDAKE
jgi:hypothetical protein